MYYKNKENKPYFEPSQAIIVRDGLVEITEEEFNQIVVAINTPTKEQEEQALKLEQSKARDEAMLAGDVYSLNNIDYNVSFTKDDGDGLVQVKSAFELGLTNTTIHFENGTNMPISSSEFTDFALWFVNKRNEFFL